MNESYRTLDALLAQKGYFKEAPGKWVEEGSGFRVRLSDRRISIFHESGALYLDEIIDGTEAMDAALRCIEKGFPLPAYRARVALSGLTNPMFFIENSAGDISLRRTMLPWPETAKSLTEMYQWRKLKKSFNIPVRGKAKMNLPKGAVFGYRENNLGKYFVINPNGSRKEYLISVRTREQLMVHSKVHTGKAPAISGEEQKPETPTSKATKSNKQKEPNAIVLLKARYGKGWTARKIKADLKGIVTLDTWPTKKLELLRKINQEYGEEIIEMLNQRSAVTEELNSLSPSERKVYDTIFSTTKTNAIGTVLRKLALTFPTGSTTDPDFWPKAIISIIKEVGPDQALKETKEAQSRLEGIKNSVTEKPRVRNVYSQPIQPSDEPLVISGTTNIPKEYHLNLTLDGTKKIKKLIPDIRYRITREAEDDDATLSLKLFIQELYRFAGSIITPTGVMSKKAFTDGRAFSEYLRVSTRRSAVSDFSAEQFLDAFLDRYKSKAKTSPIIIKKILSHTNKGRLNEKISIVVSVRGAPKDVTMELVVNPASLSSSLTKHNIYLTKAASIMDLLIARKEAASVFNLIISAI